MKSDGGDKRVIFVFCNTQKKIKKIKGELESLREIDEIERLLLLLHLRGACPPAAFMRAPVLRFGTVETPIPDFLNVIYRILNSLNVCLINLTDMNLFLITNCHILIFIFF